MLPLHLDLRGRRVVLVGGGAVAERRARTLLAEGAEPLVVAPRIADGIRALGIELRERAYEHGDLEGAWLVIAATDDRAVNERVAQDARALRAWCVRADDAASSDAIVPATGEHDGVRFSVASGDPRRSTAIRDRIGLGIADGTLDAAPQRGVRGSVVLVGGGPGDPDLVTVRGRHAVLTADVVVVDRLAPHGLLAYLDPGVEVVDAGKAPDHHLLTQDEINALIVDRARAGKRVARLKGGDPFVLGRGSEEVLACTRAGIPVEVVPGISSAIAAPAAAGIPVTHRRVVPGFVVLSGHELGDLDAVAATGLTIVVLMGVATLPELAERLVEGGRQADTPVAVIERAFAASQRTTTGTLGTIAARAAEAGVANPAVIVVGEVVTVLDEARALAEAAS